MAKLYNDFGRLSSTFVKFYVFDKGEPITSGESHKTLSRKAGFFLVLSGLFWYDILVEL